MKLGFSSLCCPTWDVRTILEQAVLMGFDGVELRGLQGELHLPLHPELAQNAPAVVEACRAMKVELACLGSSASFGSSRSHEVADQRAQVREYIELARKLDCRFVRVFTGDIPPGSNRYATLGRIAGALSDLVPYAARNQVVLLIENSGDLASSRDLWFLLDTVSMPNLQACWNPINGLSIGEHASLAIPRLGIRTSMVHIADANFSGQILQGYASLGKGTTDLPRTVELLQGIGFDGYLTVEWPRLWKSDLQEPEEFLPEAVAFLREQLSIERVPLTAYKGDKNKPRFAPRGPRTPTKPAQSSQT
jgi:sugar phosphate isomerase/epimerase